MTVHIELFSSPDCRRCRQTAEILTELILELNGHALQWRQVDVIEELDYAVELGVLATPAIAIDGRLAFTGSPSRKQLRKLICEAGAVQNA